MDDYAEFIDVADEDSVDRVEVTREMTINDRTFRVHASYAGRGRVAIELAIDGEVDEDSGGLRGEIAASDLPTAAKTLASLLGSVAVALGRGKLSSAALNEIRRRHPNAYRPWTDDDDARLSQQFRTGTPVAELAEQFGRKASAIESRLVKLGLLAPMAARLGNINSKAGSSDDGSASTEH